MPLPAALAARLARRGIIKQEKQKNEEVEEVFAEDYDDPTTTQPELIPPPDDTTDPTQKMEEEEEEEEKGDEEKLVHEVPACPNRSNKYHTCVEYCRTRWGYKRFDPEADMERKRDRMLGKYPLPEGWKEVADPETNRYYYWNTLTDQVCWLAPQHPRATITMPAEKARLTEALAEGLENSQAVFDSLGITKDEDMDVGEDRDSSGSDSEEHDFEEMEREVLRDRRRRDNRRDRRDRRGREKDDLDPMDPASYSDIPRGTWSSGLEQRGEAKTGVDITASGPLFQQRPYPSPGAVLRANRAMDDKK